MFLDPTVVENGKWSTEEYAKLMEAVKKHGKDGWAVVAALVPGRTNAKCRQRWVGTLEPTVGKKGNWSTEEDAKLVEAVKRHGKDGWTVVARLVSGRTNTQCRERCIYKVDPANMGKGKWTPDEDFQLTEAVQKLGKDSWVAVAALILGRTNIQCRSRWTLSLSLILDPTVGKKGKWSTEEDAKLMEAVQRHSKDGWAVVATLVPGRTNYQCRERWISRLDPAIGNKGRAPRSWKSEEDAKLTGAVQKLGTYWAAVATLVPGRTNKQCRKRWVSVLDP
jgi:myb proto-oncogene protein